MRQALAGKTCSEAEATALQLQSETRAMTNPNPGIPLASNLFGPSRSTRPPTGTSDLFLVPSRFTRRPNQCFHFAWCSWRRGRHLALSFPKCGDFDLKTRKHCDLFFETLRVYSTIFLELSEEPAAKLANGLRFAPCDLKTKRFLCDGDFGGH